MHLGLSRRNALLGTTVVLLLLNALWAYGRIGQGRWTAWTAYMPDLEQNQRDHPSNLLFTSEFWDERIPPSSVDVPYHPAKPAMLRDILACHPAAVIVEASGGQPQMPVRYYLYGLHDGIAECAAKSLPRGYKLADGEVAPAASNVR